MSHTCKTIQPADAFLSYQAAITEDPRNAQNSGPSVRGVGIHSKLWRNFRTLSVCFLDDMSDDDKKAFKTVIWKITKLTNLNIVFVNSPAATIKIKTDTNDDISTIGTDALLYGEGVATTYISEKPGSEFFEMTVLHEFGHVLGLQHEHLHPDANIPWNKSKVRKLYAANGWSQEEIDRNFFDPLDKQTLVLAKYDKQSIMHYSVDKNLTDGVYEIGDNKMLSENDMLMLSTIYPETPGDSPDDPSYRP